VTSLTMAVVAIVGSTGGAKYAWVMAFLGPIIAVGAAGAAGTTLTKRGLHERDAWLPYAAGLRRQGEWPLTNSADPPSVDAALAYAAAVGAAPAVVDALAPDVGPS